MRKNIFWIVTDLIFLIVFNTIFFLVGGFSHPASVWIAYGFIHFSYLMVVVTPFLLRKNTAVAATGFSIYVISSVYFLIEFVVGLIFIFTKPESFKASLIINLVITGIYAIILFAFLRANEATNTNIQRSQTENAFIKGTSSRVRLLMDRMSDKSANKALEAFYDALHSSPARSNEAVSSIEANINNIIFSLESAVSSNNVEQVISLSTKGTQLVSDRNSLLRQSY